MAERGDLQHRSELPVGPIGRHGVGWWGVGHLDGERRRRCSPICCLPTTTPAPPRRGLAAGAAPPLKLALPNTLLLLAVEPRGLVGRTRRPQQRRAPRRCSGFGCAFVMGTRLCRRAVATSGTPRPLARHLELRLAVLSSPPASTWPTCSSGLLVLLAMFAVDGAGLFQSAPPAVGVGGRAVLAFRGCRVAVRVHDLLPHAVPGIRAMNAISA